VIQKLVDISPYGHLQSEKEALLLDILSETTSFHMDNCPPYSLMVDAIGFNLESADRLEDLPFVPASLFKRIELKSVDDDEVTKQMVSSGTSGQERSKIFLDAKNSGNQAIVLTKLVREFIGGQRLPMLIVDTKQILARGNNFSARSAAVRGFLKFGKDHTFALDDDMSLNFDRIERFLTRHKKDLVLVFGFTHMIFEKLMRPRFERTDNNIKFDNSILLHGGGWKHLESWKVSNEEFKKSLRDSLNIQQCHNYYGMVEQAGSIYMECDHGYFHPSIFSEIIIRDPISFKEKKVGEIGLIQSLSVLPSSYPGHSILTEDIGYVSGIDDCGCGRKGKYFKVLGRLKDAEIRGCSNVFAGA
jgi:phenylacetate-coenzyme A ligase PaaK-like adenylate-forming protein